MSRKLYIANQLKGRMKGGAVRLAKHTNRLAVLGGLAFFDVIVCLICMFL